MTRSILIVALALVAAPATADEPILKRGAKSPSPQTIAMAQMILEQRVPAGIRAGAPQVVGQNPQDPTAANAAALIDLIQSTVAPNSWDIRGGQGSIVYFSPGGGLVVRQTGEAHQVIGGGLEQMRK